MTMESVFRQKSVDDKLKFPDDYINKIICGDSLTIMRQMPTQKKGNLFHSLTHSKRNRKFYENRKRYFD